MENENDSNAIKYIKTLENKLKQKRIIKGYRYLLFGKITLMIKKVEYE